ncbi:MAG: 2-oxoglutarate and iron-dependent oxygenase domain-containing protein [Nostoc sp.]
MKNLQVVDKGFSSVPIIDISALISGKGDRYSIGSQIKQACRESGFFYIIGHGVDESLQQRLEELSRQFFAQDLETKLKIRMALAGIAWRGYFPVGRELTSARKNDRRFVSFYTSSCTEPVPKSSSFVPLLFRSQFRCGSQADSIK